MSEDTDFPLNAEKLPWPQDISGITAKLRREGCRSIGRMKGNDDAFEVVMGTLRVLAKHATAKLVQQKKHTGDLKSDALARRARSAAMKQGDRRLKLANIRKEMEHLQKQKAALVAQDALVPSPVHKVAEITAPLPPKAPLPPIPEGTPATKETKAKSLTLAASRAGLGAPRAG